MASTIFSFSTPCCPPSVSHPLVFNSPRWKPKARSNDHSSLGRTHRLRLNTSCSLELNNSIIDTDPLRTIDEDKPEKREGEFVDSDVPEAQRFGLKEFFEEAQVLISSGIEGPLWFSPCNDMPSLDNAPILLFLPGIDGTGLGLIRHHQRLAKIFEIRCLHIPPTDRTSFLDLVNLVEITVRAEYDSAPSRPIYLVGESLGGCIALSVAALNPDVDLSLILSNPATSFANSQFQTLLHLMMSLPMELPDILGSLAADPFKEAISAAGNVPILQNILGEVFLNLGVMSSYSHVLADILPQETLLWKLKLLKCASEFTNSHLHDVKAQTLILSSGLDQFLPSQEEGQRLFNTILDCQLRRFYDKGHFLFLEQGIDLAYIIKATRFYRRSKLTDYVLDYIPPTPSETKRICDSLRLINTATAPVMLSTLQDSKIVNGLDGLPSKGPVLYVGYHMLLGLELPPLVSRIWTERKILLRGLGHPFIFKTFKDPNSYPPSLFDNFRLMGAVPVSAANFYKLFSSKSHILLYPGGAREALHRKGEEYKLFWPEQAEFVRMAARFGAKIIPFGVIGEDDFGEVVVDYDDLLKIPYFRDQITKSNELHVLKLRTENQGEVANQDFHLPWVLPKFPGRLYFLFGKPIETEGRKQELMDKDNSHQLYLKIQSEVKSCMAYLKEKRESDPYRSLLSRTVYQATHGLISETEIPSFEL